MGNSYQTWITDSHSNYYALQKMANLIRNQKGKMNPAHSED